MHIYRYIERKKIKGLQVLFNASLMDLFFSLFQTGKKRFYSERISSQFFTFVRMNGSIIIIMKPFCFFDGFSITRQIKKRANWKKKLSSLTYLLFFIKDYSGYGIQAQSCRVLQKKLFCIWVLFAVKGGWRWKRPCGIALDPQLLHL